MSNETEDETNPAADPSAPADAGGSSAAVTSERTGREPSDWSTITTTPARLAPDRPMRSAAALA